MNSTVTSDVRTPVCIKLARDFVVIAALIGFVMPSELLTSIGLEHYRYEEGSATGRFRKAMCANICTKLRVWSEM